MSASNININNDNNTAVDVSLKATNEAAHDTSLLDISTTSTVSSGTPERPVVDNSQNRFIAEPILYKTKVCRNFMREGFCYYESKCMFAHGQFDVRTQEQNTKDGLYSEEDVKRFQTKTIIALKQKTKKEAPPTFDVAVVENKRPAKKSEARAASTVPSTSTDEGSTHCANSPATPQTTRGTSAPATPPMKVSYAPATTNVNNAVAKRRSASKNDVIQQQQSTPNDTALIDIFGTSQNEHDENSSHHHTPVEIPPAQHSAHTITHDPYNSSTSSSSHYQMTPNSSFSASYTGHPTYPGYAYPTAGYNYYGYPQYSGYGACECESCSCNASINEVPAFTAPIAVPSDEPSPLLPIQSNDPRLSPMYYTTNVV